MDLQARLSRAAHCEEKRDLEKVAEEVQSTPSRPRLRHVAAPTTFRRTVRAYLGLSLPGCSPLTTWMCPMCHTKADALGAHWQSTSPTSRAARTHLHTEMSAHNTGGFAQGKLTPRYWNHNYGTRFQRMERPGSTRTCWISERRPYQIASFIWRLLVPRHHRPRLDHNPDRELQQLDMWKEDMQA